MNELFDQVEKSSGLNKQQILNYSMYAGVALVMLGIGQVYITTVLGVLYPAFMSFVALESADSDDDKQWLTYWVVYGCFQIVDQFAGIILGLIPFYFFLKLGFLIYLFHPKTLGAKTVYDDYLSQYVRAYRGEIEAQIRQATDKLSSAAESVQSAAAGSSKQE